MAMFLSSSSNREGSKFSVSSEMSGLSVSNERTHTAHAHLCIYKDSAYTHTRHREGGGEGGGGGERKKKKKQENKQETDLSR